MSDKELLELAAKAAGIRLNGWEWSGAVFYTHAGMHNDRIIQWSPLTDDGDALRLATDLRLAVLPGKHKGDGCTVESQRQGIPGCTTLHDDKREQMRRAIVHVAAEIGKAMP